MISWDEVFAERHLVLFHLRQKTLHFPHYFISSFQTMDHATLSNYEQAWLDSIAANLGSSYKMQWGMEKQEIIWLIRKQKPKHYICILKEIKFHTITLVRFCWIMQTLGFTFFWPSIIKILLHIKFSRLKNTSIPTVQTNHKNEVDISPQEERIYLFEYIILKKKNITRGKPQSLQVLHLFQKENFSFFYNRWKRGNEKMHHSKPSLNFGICIHWRKYQLHDRQPNYIRYDSEI